MATETGGTALPAHGGARVEPELTWTRLSLLVSLVAAVFFTRDLLGGALSDPDDLVKAVPYGLITAFLLYGNFVYQLTRVGYLKRLASTRHAPSDELEAAHDGEIPALLCLIPSYKEELRTVRQTLLSAALQEYPRRRVVLLIDDPQPKDGDREAHKALHEARALVARLHQGFSHEAQSFAAALEAFNRRAAEGTVSPRDEAATLSALYDRAAELLERLRREHRNEDHTDELFDRKILRAPARAHARRAAEWAARAVGSEKLPSGVLLREYRRLAALFAVEISCFERKAYANLSHEPNKAMNLNTYIGLIGGLFVDEAAHGRRNLVRSRNGSLTVPHADYILTLDADSFITADYALRLVHVMEQPGNERIAVAQTPYSAITGSESALERIAGGTTDIQYLIHQGFTHSNATYWVGANAVLRYAALTDIAHESIEDGRAVTRFIQDRTVIEDTESTIDLIHRGWSLYNYPARLAYSATPPDFGSLVIQRARWANGGLIILPKLLRYLLSGGFAMSKVRECFFRFHYLTSIAGVNFGLLLLLLFSFPEAFDSYWLPVAAAPYFALYARDLYLSGYREAGDIVRVYALNLLLVPVNLAGVLKSVHQGLTGAKIPFKRTPKIEGRTATPARYLLAVLALAFFCLAVGVYNVALGRWLRGAFSIGNAALLVYAINEFVGWRELWADLAAGFRNQGSHRPALPEELVAMRNVA